jgi:hypothetical protein
MKTIITTLGIIGAIALGNACLEVSSNEVSRTKLTEKYNASMEIKAKYQMNDVSLLMTNVKNTELDKYKGEPKDEIKVAIGDNSQAILLGGLFGIHEKEFKPDIELKRWNEVSFKIKTDNLLTGVAIEDKNLIFENNKVKFKTPKMDFEMYETEESYKYIWYLNKKPASNIVSFDVETEGLDFFYQPPLNVENKDPNLICTETQCKDRNGNVVIERPENVVGSYAVYHSTKGGINDINGKDYKVGKAFHIFRPHIIDANGAETWGILKIENGIYSVEISQDFLDKAVYPIKSNDTFGYSGTPATILYSLCSTGGPYYAKYTGVAGTGVNMSFYGQEEGNGDVTTGQMKLYDGTSDTGSEITNGITDTVAVTTTFQWYTSNFTNAPTLSATDYWLAAWTNGTCPPFGGYFQWYGDNTDGTSSSADSSNTYNTWPTSKIGGAGGSYKMGIYVTYTPSGGGAPAQDNDVIMFE